MTKNLKHQPVLKQNYWLLVPVWNMLCPRQINFTVTKHDFLHVYIQHILFHQQKVSVNNKILILIVSKKCLGKQFTDKFLGTSSTNGSLKNVLCSKSIDYRAVIPVLKVLALSNMPKIVLINVKYTRDLQLGLNKNLQKKTNSKKQ